MQTTAAHYRLTTISCFGGIFVQAIITNITALIFIPLMTLYGLSYLHLGILVGINFTAQLTVDLVFSRLIDRIGFKKLVLTANGASVVGLLLFAAAPLLFSDIMVGLIIATIIFSAASGLLEVLLSPIVNAIPHKNKGGAMTLMHSFYAWGQATAILLSTLFLVLAGAGRWNLLVLLWVLVPVTNFIMFSLSPFPPNSQEERTEQRKIFLQPYYLLALAAIFFGASTEVVMNQWVSSFAEKALQLPKAMGDLAGMCGFAILLGLGRTLHSLSKTQTGMSSLLIKGCAVAVICYLVAALSPIPLLSLAACAVCGLAASLLWPGTLVITAERFPIAGAWMFALLAAAGDSGAGFGPWLTGLVVDRFSDSGFVRGFAAFFSLTAEQASLRTGLLAASAFPLIALFFHLKLKQMRSRAAES